MWTLVTDDAGVARLRAALARRRVLYEVDDDAEGGAAWRPCDASAPFNWAARLPLEGVKRFFFPQSETLLAWHDATLRAVHPQRTPFALFGIRACDATALAYQDRFFACDPHYAARRRHAVVVAVNCLTACAGGFCVEVDAGPFARAGFDLALTRLAPDTIAVEIASSAGAKALDSAHVEVRLLTDDDEQALSRALESACASFAPVPGMQRAIARIAERDGSPSVTDDEWQRLGPSCFACTGCTSLCPTCSCFTIEDEVRGDAGVRRRVWDSCLLEGFQREASGHHPAPRPGDRVRRFWTHKFGATFERGFERFGCVGCGRCDVTCPGSIGARRVLAQLGDAQ
jgi:sulfhydrogenase subunit beta (sulfur reductase)